VSLIYILIGIGAGLLLIVVIVVIIIGIIIIVNRRRRSAVKTGDQRYRTVCRFENLLL